MKEMVELIINILRVCSFCAFGLLLGWYIRHKGGKK